MRFVGRDGPRSYPATHAEADARLRHFVRHRLPDHGRYQKVMSADDPMLAHSVLSSSFNLGLLDPAEAIRAAEGAWRDGTASLSAVEPFIRGLLGWREFLWQLYWYFEPAFRDGNWLAATEPLPGWFADLDADAVEARCLADVLAGVRDRAWAHHSQRLLVLGNYALQRGWRPAELADWFRGCFVDGADWVMNATVVGMSRYADLGRVDTRPYAVDGRYIDELSDYCGGCRYRPDTACSATWPARTPGVSTPSCTATGGGWPATRGSPRNWPSARTHRCGRRCWPRRTSAAAARPDRPQPRAGCSAQKPVTSRWKSSARSIWGRWPVSANRWARARGSRARAAARCAAGRIRSRSPQITRMGRSSRATASSSSARHPGATPRNRAEAAGELQHHPGGVRSAGHREGLGEARRGDVPPVVEQGPLGAPDHGPARPQQQPAERSQRQQAQGDRHLRAEAGAVDQDQAGRAGRVVGGQPHRDRPAEGVADQVGGAVDAEGVEAVGGGPGQRRQGVRLVQRRGAAVPGQVEADHPVVAGEQVVLVGEVGEGAADAVQQHHRRALPGHPAADRPAPDGEGRVGRPGHAGCPGPGPPAPGRWAARPAGGRGGRRRGGRPGDAVQGEGEHPPVRGRAASRASTSGSFGRPADQHPGPAAARRRAGSPRRRPRAAMVSSFVELLAARPRTPRRDAAADPGALGDPGRGSRRGARRSRRCRRPTSSCRSASVKPRTANLLAAVGGLPGRRDDAEHAGHVDQVGRPGAAFSAGSRAWVSRTTARKLTSITQSNSSRVTWSNRPPRATPALLTSSVVRGWAAASASAASAVAACVGEVDHEGVDRRAAGGLRRIAVGDAGQPVLVAVEQDQVAAARGQAVRPAPRRCRWPRR